MVGGLPAYRRTGPPVGTGSGAADDRSQRPSSHARESLDPGSRRRSPPHRSDGVSARRPVGSIPRRGRPLLAEGAFMKVRLWGTRGSLASPGAETARYGGNTACVEVRGRDGMLLVLDAGTGIRRLGATLPETLVRVNVLLTHLHMDHIQGLGFFTPLHDPKMEIHI